MHELFTRALIGFACSLLIAGTAYWRRSLSGSGSFAAVWVGTVLYTFGTLSWYCSLLAFFISSSLLSKWRSSQKDRFENLYEKTGRRDAGQVLANGGAASIVCLLSFFYPSPYFWVLFMGILATANADTWATEVGTALKGRPRSILTFRAVEPGTSGAVSLTGTLAALAGASFIAWMGLLAEQWTASTSIRFSNSSSIPFLWIVLMFSISIGGFLGALFDSILGASLQAQYQCVQCGAQLERAFHHQLPCRLIKGNRYITNDIVNVTSTAVGGFVSLLCTWIACSVWR